MTTTIFTNETNTYRVTSRNFWFTVEARSGGRWRKQFSTRDREVAIAIASKY